MPVDPDVWLVLDESDPWRPLVLSVHHTHDEADDWVRVNELLDYSIVPAWFGEKVDLSGPR